MKKLRIIKYMCGIAGIISVEGKSNLDSTVRSMIDKLKHRGPDDEGIFSNEIVALGHKRLSIIDLSSAGHQPMCNEDETIWIVCNGEIYNYLDLARELKKCGHVFRSHTDTEVIIHAYEEYGTDCLKRFNGMWAFAIWDSKRKRLFCARDRLGIKPFYYHINNGSLFFASEPRALLIGSITQAEPDEQAIFDYLAYDTHDYLDHSERCFFKGINQLQPANFMLIDQEMNISIKRFWDIQPGAEIDTTLEEAVDEFESIFSDSIRLRLQSDVPLGTCLSGGLDSSAIVCMVNELYHNKKIVTFTAGFPEYEWDESVYAQAVNKAIGAEGNIVYPKAEELLNELTGFIEVQGEPVTNVSQWASYRVMKMVREKGVTVVLNGQGSDEIFAGYSVYYKPYFKDLLLEKSFVKLFKEMFFYHNNHHQRLRPHVVNLLRPLIPTPIMKGRRLCKGIKNEADPFPSWLDTSFKTNYAKEIPFPRRFETNLENWLYHYLVKDRLPSLLRFEDRNSMAFSIESRLPFLDYRLVEFAFRLPRNFKLNKGVNKIILRDAMKNRYPEVVKGRIRKMGFTTPQSHWMRMQLRNWVEEIINSRSFGARGYFNSFEVNRYINRYLKGEPVNDTAIWKILNLELWLRQNCMRG